MGEGGGEGEREGRWEGERERGEVGRGRERGGYESSGRKVEIR